MSPFTLCTFAREAIATGILAVLQHRVVRRRKPDLVIGGDAMPYMLRWRLFPKNPLANIYLHRFMRDDDDRALHDHPWPSLSFILAGGYHEVLPREAGREFEPGSTLLPGGNLVALWRPVGSILLRRPLNSHRITVPFPGETWTLFFVGPRLRDWGFRCPQGFIPWRAYTVNDGAEIGKGCDQ